MVREVRLTQLQENFKKIEKQEKDEVNNMEQFVILPERAERQLLQINLIPAGIVYFRGEKIYSNSSQLKITHQNQLVNFWNRIFKRDNNLSMFINDTQAIKILGMKHTVFSGQILILDLAVYKQSFYYSFQNLIASKKAFLKQQSSHPIFPELRLIQHKKKLQNVFDALDVNQQTIVLQAESSIMEKYLAEDEEFYICHRNSLLAVSKDVKLELVRQGSVFGLKAKGKGWLFYQTNKNQIKFSTKWKNIVFYLILLSYITPVLQLMLADMI